MKRIFNILITLQAFILLNKSEYLNGDLTTRFDSEYVCNINDFQPYADGVTLDDHALRAALSKCKNGGVLYFPKGSYLLSPFNMSTDMELYLDRGATILANNNFSAWPIIQPLPSYPDDYHGGRLGAFIGDYS
jgi:polygalacturonase